MTNMHVRLTHTRKNLPLLSVISYALHLFRINLGQKLTWFWSQKSARFLAIKKRQARTGFKNTTVITWLAISFFVFLKRLIKSAQKINLDDNPE